MDLQDLGYNEDLERFRAGNNLTHFEIGRIVAEHKERYLVATEKGELDAEIAGKLRFSARSREDFPAVGDWVSLSVHDSDFAIIHGILPRSSTISRQAVERFGEIQVIAANVDCAFVVQAVDRDFNINRLERYLTLCNAANVVPIVVLTKTDLIDGRRTGEIVAAIRQRLENVPVVAISNETRDGIDALGRLIERGKTYCMLGSSGVGKSTLLNNLSGTARMRTDAISASTHKGRHVTTHRELIVLESGGMLIDNPGMREVGIVDSAHGLEMTFDRIFVFSRNCKFKDCTHANEAGCSVLKAVEDGELDRAAYESYLKMEKEKAHFESTAAERRKRDRDFGKRLKHYKKGVNKHRD